MDNLFRQEVSMHRQSKLDGKISLIQPTSFKYFTLLLFSITTLSLLFLFHGDYSRKEEVSGILTPDKGVIKLRSYQSAVISELLVEEDQYVDAGQVLLRTRSEQFGEKGFEINQSLIQQYRFEVDSISRQLIEKEKQSKLQVLNLKSRLFNLNEELKQIGNSKALLKKRIIINNEITDKLEELSLTGYASELEYKRQSDSILLLEQQWLNLETQQLSITGKIEETTSQLNTLTIESRLDSSNLKERLNEAEFKLSRAKQQKITEFVSPTAGTVSGILVEQGSIVENQTSLLSIVPAGSELIAELFIPTSAIGFVETNQRVKLRYKAFPYERFGMSQGTIIEVSNTMILPSEYQNASILTAPSYRVKVRLDRQFVKAYGKRFSLRPDMQIDADIVIEERSLLRWLFDPIFSLKG